TWALSDPSGKVAQVFASAEPAPPLGWLRHVEAAGLLGLTTQQSETEGKRNLLVSQTAGATATKMSDVTSHLARWLARHVHNTELARWVIANGCVLHPNFRLFIHHQIKGNNTLRSDLRAFWSIIASEAFASLLLRYYHGSYVSEFFDVDLSTADAHRVADSLMLVPILSYYDSRWDRVFAGASTESDGAAGEEDGDVSVMWHVVNLELKLLSGDASLAILEKARSDPELLVALVPWLTQNLIEA